jgi:hypothetical protein
MFQIGPSLREARTRRGLSAADVHKAVRIRERYLTALEEERWDMLPGDTYTKGFLRTYAEFLGLDGQLYVDEFNARVAAHEEEPFIPESLGASSGPGSPILVRTIAAVVVVAAVGTVLGLVAWGRGGSAHRTPVKTTQAAGQTVRRTHRSTPARTTKAAVAPGASYAVIRAARDRSWLDVRVGGPNGKELYRGTLELGASLRYGLARPIWVRMGRPYALDIRIGAKLVPGLPADPANLLLRRRGPATP